MPQFSFVNCQLQMMYQNSTVRYEGEEACRQWVTLALRLNHFKLNNWNLMIISDTHIYTKETCKTMQIVLIA